MPVLFSPLLPPLYPKDSEYPLITTVGPRHLRVQAWSDAILGQHYVDYVQYDCKLPSTGWYAPNSTQKQWHVPALHFTTQLLKIVDPSTSETLTNKDLFSCYTKKHVVIGLIDIFLFPAFSYFFMHYSGYFIDLSYMTMQFCCQLIDDLLSDVELILRACCGLLFLTCLPVAILFCVLSIACAIPGLILESLRCCIGYSLIHLITLLTIPKEADQAINPTIWSSVTSCILINQLCEPKDLTCELLSEHHERKYRNYRNSLFGFYNNGYDASTSEGISILKELKKIGQSITYLDEYLQTLARGQSENNAKLNKKPSTLELDSAEKYLDRLEHFGWTSGLSLSFLLRHHISAFRFIENYQILQREKMIGLLSLYHDQENNPLFLKLMQIPSDKLPDALSEVITKAKEYIEPLPLDPLTSQKRFSKYKCKTTLDTTDFLTTCGPCLDSYVERSYLLK